MTSSQTLYQSSQEIGVDVNVFPDICAFSQVDVLNPQYVPEE
jgi:hypothetical protein